MILANVAAAETLERAHIPLVYRVHDEPAMEKVQALREFLATLDIPFGKSGVLKPEAFNRVLARVKVATPSNSSTKSSCARRRRPNIRPRTTAISA